MTKIIKADKTDYAYSACDIQPHRAWLPSPLYERFANSTLVIEEYGFVLRNAKGEKIRLINTPAGVSVEQINF